MCIARAYRTMAQVFFFRNAPFISRFAARRGAADAESGSSSYPALAGWRPFGLPGSDA
jgi:hypothetical protein